MVTGQARELPVAVDVAVYRIIQEALTNVVRHSGADAARVGLGYQPDALDIDVVDPGGPLPVQTSSSEWAAVGVSGRGIAGMTERAAGLDGWLHAGSEPDGGFGVHARLPLAGL